MAKFRTSTEGSTSVRNYMGARSFKQSPKEELVFATVTTFVEDSYYESKEARLNRISELVKIVGETDPLFVAKLALVTRRDFHLRSAYHVLVGELSKVHTGDSLVADLIIKATERPDDLMEILSYKTAMKSNQVKKGVAAAMAKFNEYALSKYKGEGKSFSLADSFNVTHPRPVGAEKEALYRKVIRGELSVPETWEVMLSGGMSHAEVWKKLISENKLGYMALIRNLRNIIDYADDQTFSLAMTKVASKEAVHKSKQMPFRFLSAYLAVTGEGGSRSRKVRDEDEGVTFEKGDGKKVSPTIKAARVEMAKEALEKAVRYSVENIPLLEGKTMILIDNSGSMRGDYGGASLASAMSQRTTADSANLLGLLYWTRADNTYVGLFGDNLIKAPVDRSKSVFENFRTVNTAAESCGPATEKGIFTAFKDIIAEKTMVDRIVIFSDSQVGDGCQWYGTRADERGGYFNALFEAYRRINPEVRVYNIDIKGYGNKLMANGVVLLAGFSEKTFELMHMLESGGDLVALIEREPWGENQ